MNLPEDFRVDTARLAGCFRNTSATYKFYWFLALLAEAKKGQEKIDKISLFAQMVAQAWHAVNYFKISFGAADKLGRAISRIRDTEGLAVDAGPDEVYRALIQSERKETKRELRHFDANVPHKFLSPWLDSGTKGTVYERSREGCNHPYALYNDHILLQPVWGDYFKNYAGILRGFCLWHLTLFLQVRNPHVPDIPNKLMRPERRGSLSAHKTRFWDLVVDELGGVNCIYTGRRLGVGEYAMEHFIPFQFVAHDQMWNLIPADPSFNSSKGDRLPLDRHFDGFCTLQRKAVGIVKSIQSENRFLEDYLHMFKTHDFDDVVFRQTMVSLRDIAANNGFLLMKDSGVQKTGRTGG